MNTYTEVQFLKDVKAEATALKQYASKDELEKLNDEIINPFHYQECVYGLMTGDCYSERASELIFNCCKKFFVSHIDEDYLIDLSRRKPNLDFNEISDFVNGSVVPGVSTVEDFHTCRKNENCDEHYSSIEAYIIMEDAKIPELIAFLKDETQTLEL